MSEQFDWRSAAAARGLKVTDLAEHVATSIEGIDLADDHDEEMIAIIRAACVARTLLLFRGQGDLSPAGYLAFANRFGGRPDLHSLRHYCLPEHHEIFVVGNVHEEQAKVGSPKVGLNWHTDHYHLPEPGLFTYLHAIQVPEGQGDTRYANGIAAYEALPEARRAEIDGLKVLHSRARLFRNASPTWSVRRDPRERPRRGRVRHAVDVVPGQRQSDGTADHDRCAARSLGAAHHRGDPLFRLCPPGPPSGRARRSRPSWSPT
jgi:taurine dioxygenase